MEPSAKRVRILFPEVETPAHGEMDSPPAELIWGAQTGGGRFPSSTASELSARNFVFKSQGH